jgi:hypothetical protein
MTDNIVEISGCKYRYSYDPETQATVYKGPVGASPALSESEFEKLAVVQQVILSPEEKMELGHASIKRWNKLGQPDAFVYSPDPSDFHGLISRYEDKYAVTKDITTIGGITVNVIKIYDQWGNVVHQARGF